MKKDKYIVIHGGDIQWRVKTNSSKFYRFKSNKDIALINPMYYYSKTWSSQVANSQRFVKLNDEYQISTRGLIFKKYVEEVEPMSFMDYLRNLIYHIRIISKQSTLNPPNFVEAFSIMLIEDLEKIPKVQEVEMMMMPGNIFTSMVTWEMVIEADKRINKNFKIPIYVEILTDALNGLMNHEYKKTILYSSIAIESMLAIKLDIKYEEIINKRKNSKSHRVSKFTTSSGQTYKDPIYQRLKEKTDFSFLLHERPLYLWNKSLLIENENLYKSAKKLYSTRNKIVHWGEPDSSISEYVQINYEGAQEAFSIARQIFQWAGIDEFDNVLINGFVELKKNERPTFHSHQ